ncbi:uncharacterized protein CcaverHIS019_0312300 [Cutaneotrichosporon cavernicola]|uniref:Zn(2)-C6 fungal-type domain-containing protein n=1 Tax=Cutaneotrichosporon cavernicola TaxID=279322 RepID=A0AA48L3A1_9TREE|nr:uncharacterized protein CcaverHIS019_0312300 [Cutaneotrichosporon cavernicola]BEI91160.1 hypothetical protein CcaverHIS019_0312300 [Cutaneotrichosporon cavernicola]BEI98937.1 hypothetical protein CcaverHIS631_0312360 [Cutaneotrichosporon cavernicola]BEJ06711.1 hypothetical protein CcaverHIS641_0312330 [Cutaneotrichosporon cavernicola]
MADRACHRCIAKKRRCDHQRPVCGTCKKLNLEGECSYPPPQLRRGPVAGMSRRAEHRAQQCENALWFLLSLPGVQEAIDRVDPDVLARPFVPAPTANMERGERNEWWGEHTMRQPADVLMFRDACRRLQGDPTAPPNGNGAEAHEAEPSPSYEYYDHRDPSTQSTTHSPAPDPPQPERRRDEMRNAMGPSLWQLVTAAIPDEDEPEARRGPEAEWARPMWTAPPPRDDYPDGPKRKRRADLFW